LVTLIGVAAPNLHPRHPDIARRGKDIPKP
jgi:hypothetical protein